MGHEDAADTGPTRRMMPFDCDLLVVGLGPVGDAMAGLARIRGLSVIAIDRDRESYPLPRAAVFDHEIMRIFQMLGVAERIAPLCRIPDRYQFLTASREVLLDFDTSVPSAISAWNETYALHQPAVEEVLRERLIELGVDLRTGTAFSSLDQDLNGVTATLSEPGRGAYQIRSRYLVGCDGAWSPVREAIGGGLADYAFDEPWLVIDAIAHEPNELPIACQQICDPVRPVTYLAMSAPRHRWEFMLKPGEDANAITSDTSIANLLAPWTSLDKITIERKAVYRFHGLVAKRWHDRRVLIAGDAAHQMPPFAGQGMCSGIRDAANLAWKLDLVVRGKAGGELLESYQAEREPHVRAVIETAIGMGRVVCLLDPAAAAERDRQMLARKASGAKDIPHSFPGLSGGCLMETPLAGDLFPQAIVDGQRLDPLLGPNAWLIGRGLPTDLPELIQPIDVASPANAKFAKILEAWLSAHDVPAVLVRPDRHIFGTGEAVALLQRWASMVG